MERPEKNGGTVPVRRSMATLAVGLALAGVGAWLALRLELDPGLEALLPADSVSVLSIDETRKKLALDEPLTVLVDSENVENNQKLIEELGRTFAAWPDTTWVMTDYGLDELAARALYYIDADTLREWSELAEESLDWEVCKLSPLCVQIADPPELPSPEDIRGAIDISAAGSVLRELTGRSAKKATADRGDGGSSPALCNDEGTTCAVQVMLGGSPGDLGYAGEIKRRVDEVARPLAAAQEVPTRIEAIGRYRAAPMEHEIIVQDLHLVSVLAAAGALLIVLFFFRDFIAVVQLMVPMLTGLAVAVGSIAVVEPKLNIISASALAILAGMAIDFGIHLLMHYQSIRSEGLNAADAAETSVRELWVALVVAGLTTACGFAALSMTDFQGFSQMGWMASLGIVVTLLWTLAIFPAIMRLVPGRAGPAVRRAAKDRSHRKLAWFVLVLGVVALPIGAQVGFESNLGKLQPEGVAHGLDASMMRARGDINALYLSDSTEAIDEALGDVLMTTGAKRVLGEEPIVVSSSLILPEDSAEKTKILDEMRVTLERTRKIGIERGNQALIEQLDEIQPWLDVPGPPEAAHLPPWLASILVSKNGAIGRSGVIYIPVRGSDAAAMERLAAWLDDLRAAHPEVTFASTAALLGEVTPALVSDAPWIIALVFLGLVVATAVASRSGAVTLDVFLATLLSTVLFAATLTLLQIDLHLYNLLAVPVVIGLAVDGAVHVRWAYDTQSPREQYATFRAVAASTLTSMAAFGALLAAHSPGLRSLGKVGVIGLAVSLAVNLLWLRGWCAPRQTAIDSRS